MKSMRFPLQTSSAPTCDSTCLASGDDYYRAWSSCVLRLPHVSLRTISSQGWHWRLPSWVMALALALCLQTTASSQSAFATFTVIDVPGASYTFAYGINNSGTIVGSYYDPASIEHAFTRSGQIYQTIDIPGYIGTTCRNSGWTEAATGINNSGQIAGEYVRFNPPVAPGICSGSVSAEAFLFANNTPVELNNITDNANVFPNAINDAGVIVGSYQVFVNRFRLTHAFLLEGGAYTTIDPPGASQAWATGINNAGQIVGYYNDASGNIHGFFLSRGTYSLIDFPGATGSQFVGINSSGVAVGNYFAADGRWTVFVFDTNAPQSPNAFQSFANSGGVFLTASAINDAGQIVGTDADQNGGYHGFIATLSNLASPTNLRATQIGTDGTQIQLTWDYGSDPIDGFKLERQTPQERITNTWESISTNPSVGTPGHWYALDTTASSFAAYNYRVRAYHDSTDSDESNEAACFQLHLQTIRNNLQMLATFQPDTVSLSAAAGAFGFTHFNWISFLTYAKNDPTCVLGIGPGCLKAANGALFPFPPPPLIDPPYPGGWSYLPADALPYYWNEQAGFDTTYFLTPHETPTLAPTTLDFNDLPVVPWWVPSDHYEYSTHLVGITVPFGSAQPQYKTLASFTWSTNFSVASGGILEYRISNLVPPDNPGSGSIFNTQLVTPEELPASIRSALTSSGAVGISTAPKMDKDAPSTAAFLSGVQSANGWYTGPVTVTLIATDIDGPSDIAATSYRLDGGAVVAYTGPFTVSGVGTHTIVFGSVDQALNAENPLPSQTFTIVAKLPTILCTGCYFLINGIRATLAFNVGVVGSGSTFSYNYRTATQIVQFVSTTTSQIALNGNTAIFSGQGKLNGLTGYSFTVTAADGGTAGSGLDSVSMSITGPNNYSYSVTASVVGGDIVVHQ